MRNWLSVLGAVLRLLAQVAGGRWREML